MVPGDGGVRWPVRAAWPRHAEEDETGGPQDSGHGLLGHLPADAGPPCCWRCRRLHDPAAPAGLAQLPPEALPFQGQCYTNCITTRFWSGTKHATQAPALIKTFVLHNLLRPVTAPAQIRAWVACFVMVQSALCQYLNGHSTGASKSHSAHALLGQAGSPDSLQGCGMRSAGLHVRLDLEAQQENCAAIAEPAGLVVCSRIRSLSPPLPKLNRSAALGEDLTMSGFLSNLILT